MPKLKVMSGREIRAILEANGFIYARQKGSHMIMTLALEGTSITVSVPDHKEVAIGTMGSIVNRSGLPRDLFEV
jgi:predicted RNA binding protein YcfA (HicA-like mRNA interferase family)